MRYSYLLLIACLFACSQKNETNISSWQLIDYKVSYYDTITGQKAYEERPDMLKEYDGIMIVDNEIQFVNKVLSKKANHIKILEDDTTKPFLRLLSYSGYVQQSEIFIKWETAVEHHISHFELYVSHDGKEFVFLDKILAESGTSRMNYVCIDKNPKPGINYYQLYCVDVSGEKVVSNIIAINYSTGNVNKLINDGERIYLPFAIGDFYPVSVIYKNDHEMLWEGMKRDIRFYDSKQEVKTGNKKLEMKFTR